MSLERAFDVNESEPAQPPRPGREKLARLPAPSTPLVGRGREIVDLHGMLASAAVRLITLTGPGGIGKTRLAIAVAGEIAGDVAFVPLAAITDAELVAPTIAQAIGLEMLPGSQATTSLRDALRDRELLLVLDNFEHVREAAGLLGALLIGCPNLQLLVTSRSRLGIAGEHVVPVEPLDLPTAGASVEAIATADAVQLFAARAQAAHPRFRLTESNAMAVLGICRRLDGLPLAIELAAARSNLLSPQALLARLENRLNLLSGGPQDAPARLQTIQAAIAWSWDLLDETSRRWWARLGVFAGSFTADAAAEVGNGDTDPLTMLQSLIDQALLRPIATADGEPRFVLLESMREFAQDQLTELGVEHDAHAAHARYYRNLAIEAEPGLMSNDPEAWFNRLAADIANLRAAMNWLTEHNEPQAALELCGALAWFWTAPNYIAEGRAWYDLLLTNTFGVTAAVRAKALNAAAELAHWHSDSASATALHQEALPLWRESGDQRMAAATLRGLGSVLVDQEEYAAAVVALQEAYDLSLALGDAWNSAAAANLLGIAVREAGDVAAAIRWHETALTLFSRHGYRDHVTIALDALGFAHMQAGDWQRAWESFDAALTLGVEFDSDEAGKTLIGFGLLAVRHGQPGVAVRMLAADHAWRTRHGIAARPFMQRWIETALAESRTALGNTSYLRHWDAGRNASLADMFEETRTITVPQPVVADGLTSREHEVLALLVDGLSDTDIADRLYISKRTASKHVAAILDKLGATNRTAAATIALRRGLF